MSVAEPVVPLTDGGTEDVPSRATPFGHPRGALRAIPRFPKSTSDVEADRLVAAHRPIQIPGGIPVGNGPTAPSTTPAAF
jgi:hypothetical protein